MDSTQTDSLQFSCGDTPLDSVIITDQINSRPSKPADYKSEAAALSALAESLSLPTDQILQKVTDAAMRLCKSDSAGISLAEPDGNVFRWKAVSGQLGKFLNGTLPLNFSPCGEVLKQGRALLMQSPEQHYSYISELGLSINEVLLMPFYHKEKIVGTLWLVFHTKDRQFDAEDLRILTSLSHFAGAAFKSSSLRRKSEEARADADATNMQLRNFFTQAPTPLVILEGPDFVYTLANPPYEKMVGRKVLGKKVLEVFTETEVGSFVEQLRKVYQTGVPYIGRELPLHIPDESGVMTTRYLEVGYYPFRNAKNEIVGLFAIHYDLTNQVLSRKQLELSQNAVLNERSNFQNLFRQTPEMVVILKGPDHIFEFVNEAHTKVLGFDATGLSVRKAQPESVEVHGILDDVYRTGTTAHLKEIPITVGENLRYFDLTYSARRDDEGKINGVMVLGMEVTNEFLLRQTLNEREAHFRELVDNSPATMWITDNEAKCVYLSRGWYEITGRTPKEDLGYGWIENIHPDDKEQAGNLFFKAVANKDKLSLRYRLRYKNGDYRWVLDSGLPRISNDGQFLGYIGTVIDIHDQIEMETNFQDLQARFKKSATATNLGVWYCDLPFDELIWNDETKEHFFIPTSENVTIERFYQHLHPEDRERTRASINFSIENRTPYDIRYRTVDPKDPARIKWIRAIGWTDYDANGKPIRFDGITLDITTEQQRQHELKVAKEEAERANSLKSTFLANMSHEIRTPLGAMIGFADLLRDPSLNIHERTKYLEVLTRNGNNLAVIINDILDFSKIEAGHINLDFTDTNPNQAVSDVVSLLALKAKEKDIKLEFHSEVASTDKLTTDPIRLKQIILNLVGNAIKFTHAGTVRITLSAETTETGKKYYEFEIIDTGIGIEPSQHEKVFEMFEQADGSMARKFGGTGLGLALSRQLARTLGGDITLVSSSPNHGSTFRARIQHQPQLKSVDTLPTSNSPDSSDIPEGILNGIKVLIVDDSLDNRELIGHYLKKRGAILDTANNGLIAYDKALSQDYDIVLMDIQMPEMDGYTATHNLRVAGYTKPIIALTAHVMDDVRQRCLNIGCTGHLPKPINPNQLISTIVEHTRNH